MKRWLTIVAALLVAGQVLADELVIGEQGTLSSPIKGYIEVFLGVSDKRYVLFPADKIRLVRSGVENLAGATNELLVQTGHDSAPLLVIRVEERIIAYTAIRDVIGRATRP